MVGAISKTVAASATPERLSATHKRVSWVTIQSKSTNGGMVSIGTGQTAGAVVTGYEIANSGDSIVLWSLASRDLAIDLYDIWIIVAVNGEGVNAFYAQA